MRRGDTGSQGENTGVDKEWSGEEEVVLCLGSWPFKTPPRTQKHTLSMLDCPEFAAVELIFFLHFIIQFFTQLNLGQEESSFSFMSQSEINIMPLLTGILQTNES